MNPDLLPHKPFPLSSQPRIDETFGEPAAARSGARSFRRMAVDFGLAAWMAAAAVVVAQPLPGTSPLDTDSDPATAMVAGIDRFLDRTTERAMADRSSHWRHDTSSPERYSVSVQPNRERLRVILGVIDDREPVRVRLETLATGLDVARAAAPALVGAGKGFHAYAVSWNVFRNVRAEGLLLEPDYPAVANVVALPDCDWQPEWIAGIKPGLPAHQQFARRLAEQQCRVLIPLLIDRGDRFAGYPGVGTIRQTQREVLWRLAYQLGRTMAGYEIQETLAAVDWLEGLNESLPIGVAGFGEGGMVAFYAAALDTRIDAAAVSGYFQPRESLYSEPIYRNVWSLLTRFGDAEIASLIAPRALILEHGAYPETEYPPPGSASDGAAPGRLVRPDWDAFNREATRAAKLTDGLFRETAGKVGTGLEIARADATSVFSKRSLTAFLRELGHQADPTALLGFNREDLSEGAHEKLRFVFHEASILDVIGVLCRAAEINYQFDSILEKGIPDRSGRIPETGSIPVVTFRFTDVSVIDALESVLAAHDLVIVKNPGTGIARLVSKFVHPAGRGAFRSVDRDERLRRLYLSILGDTQHLMRESEFERERFWEKAPRTDATDFDQNADWYRDYFHREIIGYLPPADVPARPRTRKVFATREFTGYEVMLDVYPEVFAFGILLVPTDIRPGERRPVIVCQHGLEGRPRDVADPGVDSPYYHQFACNLARRGFVTFAPQNPYIGDNSFRQVLRKAQPLQKTLYSFIHRQHETALKWLASLEFVDPGRIGFYGLSYGGKTAVRIPALLEGYALSICSADFNEWIWKNVSARHNYCYVYWGEYDMPEFNLANTFNYAEMSWMIFPRPFMVERGTDDGVAPDRWVAYEYARTRRHYMKLGLGHRTEIEFFNGPHTIHGQGTFDFLHRHLNWPKR